MRILHTVEFYNPSVGGAQEVVRQLSERLARMGHEVTVATTRLPERGFRELNGVTIEEFDVRGNMARGMVGEITRYQDFLLGSEFDVMMNYAAQQWTTDATLPVLDQLKMKKVLVPCGFSGLYDPLYAGYFRSMKEHLRQYDCCIYLSDNYRDINFARANGLTNGRLIPNGCGSDEFDNPPMIDIRKKYGIPQDHLLILHVGSHTGLKGHKEAIKIFNKAPLKNAVFLLVGNRTSSGCWNSCRLSTQATNVSPRSLIRDKRVILAELSRPETVAAYHQADLFLFPSAVECSPLVLFEAMASFTPFLTTDVGNAREIIGWSDGGILLPTGHGLDGKSFAQIDGSVKLLEQIANDRDAREIMAKAGHSAWQAMFTWEAIVKEYERTYQNLIDGVDCAEETIPSSKRLFEKRPSPR